MDWLSQVVEAVSGQTIDKYLEDNIFGPLGMTRTTFAPSQAERASLVTVHARRADGTIKATDFDWVPIRSTSSEVTACTRRPTTT